MEPEEKKTEKLDKEIEPDEGYFFNLQSEEAMNFAANSFGDDILHS